MLQSPAAGFVFYVAMACSVSAPLGEGPAGWGLGAREIVLGGSTPAGGVRDPGTVQVFRWTP